MTNLTTAANEYIRLADHAAAQSDRWLMMVLLFVLLGGAAFAVWWLMKRNQELALQWQQDAREARETIERNTEAFKEFRDIVVAEINNKKP